MNDDDQFYAWLDGELDEATAAQVATRVAADPELTALAEQHRAMRDSLRSAFGTLDDSPAPRFDSAPVVDLAERRMAKAVRPSFGLPQWAAMAATLVVGLVAGTVLRPEPSGPVASRSGSLYAAASLDKALDTQLASAAQNGPVRVGLTFRDRDGAICRTFSGDAGQGLACRSDGDWKVQGLFAPAPKGGDYRMAAGEDPRLAAMVDESIAGEPLDADGEAAAHSRGWR